MRVAQVTLDVYDNYGNILQKYALHHSLKKFADFTEVLWLKDNNFFHDLGTWFSHKRKIDGYDLANPQRKHYYEAIRTFKFKEFENRFIKTRFDIPYLEEIGDEYDFFVVGSDQVWRPKFVLKEFPGMFLENVPREKKIAYAASIAVEKIPKENLEFFRRGISNFENISMREQSGVRIVKELIGRDVPLLVDPVFLLTAKEWLKIAQKPSWINEKYERGFIFAYSLRGVSEEILQYFSKKMNLPAVIMLNSKNFWHYVTGPEEFVWLMANASLVYSGSFHGTAFAALFKKPLVVHGWVGSTFDRIKSLLNLFNLNDCKIEGNDYTAVNPFELDYGTLEKVLSLEREKSFKFLSDALKTLPIRQPEIQRR